MEPVIIRRREVLGPAEHTSIHEDVVCPASGATVGLARCDSCGHSSGVVHEPKRGLRVVDCDLAPPEYATVHPDRMRKGALDPVRLASMLEVLSPTVVCVTLDTPVASIATALARHCIGAVPVVDDARRVVGIISLADLRKQSATRRLAREIMTPDPVTVPEASPAVRAAAVMAFEGIHHLPVVDGTNQLVGLVSSLDLLRFLGRMGGYLVPETSRRQGGAQAID